MPHSGRRNLIAGLFALGLGGYVVWESAGYRVGTLTAMGPGFFPLALGIILVLLALGVIIGALRSDEAAGKIKLRPLLVIPGAIVLFALLIDRVGFLVPAFLTVVVAGLADRQSNIWVLFALAAFLTAAAYLIFGLLLGMPIRLVMWSP